MSASKIQSTTNYSRFKFMDGNRPVNSARVRKLIKSIKRKDMLQQFPIVCQKNSTGLYIMDGQHRYTAAMNLGKPIYFVEAKNIDITDVAATNSAQKGWNPSDYVASYAAQGNPEYQALRDFVDEHGFGVAISSALLGGGLTEGGGHAELIRSGNFKVKDLSNATRVAAATKACARFFPDYKNRGFILAMARLVGVKGFSITRLLQKMEHQSTRMVKCATWVQYVELIEEIYNWKARADDIVALSIEVKRSLAKQ